MLRPIVVVVALAAVLPARAQEFRIEEVPNVLTLNANQLKPKTIAFSDHAKDELADPASGLIGELISRERHPLQPAATPAEKHRHQNETQPHGC